MLVEKLGGEVRVGEKQEYGRMEIEVLKDRGLFDCRKSGAKQIVWMSHGDEAVRLPNGFQVVARSQQGAVAAVENPVRRFYGLQYHPEVTHSPEGMETLRQFLFNVCGCTAGWTMTDVMEEEIKVIKEMVGTEDHVICALSGGVDSTVAATLVHKAIGDRLHCVFVDNGLLSYNSSKKIRVSVIHGVARVAAIKASTYKSYFGLRLDLLWPFSLFSSPSPTSKSEQPLEPNLDAHRSRLYQLPPHQRKFPELASTSY